MKIRLLLIILMPLFVVAYLFAFIRYLYNIIVDVDRAWHMAIAHDQLANAAFNGNPDKTISARAYKHSLNDEHRECWAVWLCKVLDILDPNHCEKSKDT